MKKIAIVLGLGLMMVTSCQKDYTCSCTFTDSTPMTTVPTTTSETVITGKKNDVRTTCERGSYADGYTSMVCEVK